MMEPYGDALQAIRAALNVDARSLYKSASWQQQMESGYPEGFLPPPPGDLNRVERFQQDCMTLAFFGERMPAHLWAVLVLRHSLHPANKAEHDRLVWAMMVCAGNVEYADITFARWAVLNWAGRLNGVRARWERWVDHELSVRTLKRHYSEQIVIRLKDQLKLAESTADRLLRDAGLISKIAA